jgi:hypothetical protein
VDTQLHLDPSLAEAPPHEVIAPQHFSDRSNSTTSPLLADQQSIDVSFQPPSLERLQDLETQSNDARCLQWREIAPVPNISDLDEPQEDNECEDDVDMQEHMPPGEAEEESVDMSHHSGSYEDPTSPAASSPWVIDNTLSNLLFQIFQNPGEEIAFSYCKYT